MTGELPPARHRPSSALGRRVVGGATLVMAATSLGLLGYFWFTRHSTRADAIGVAVGYALATAVAAVMFGRWWRTYGEPPWRDDERRYVLPHTTGLAPAMVVLIVAIGLGPVVFVGLPLRFMPPEKSRDAIAAIAWVLGSWAAMFAVILLYAWVKRVQVLPGGLRSRTLRSRIELAFADIRRVEIAVESTATADGSRYTLRISGTHGKRIEVNMPTTPKRDLAIVVDAVATHAPHAAMSDAVRRLRTGSLPL